MVIMGIACLSSAAVAAPKPVVPLDKLKQYQEINVGWVDLGEDNYKLYGYDESNKKEWKELLDGNNLENFPKFLKGYLPGKTINTAKSINETPAAKGLVITFSKAIYTQQTSSVAQSLFGIFAGSDALDVAVRYTDGQTGVEIYSTMVNVTSRAGTSYGSMGFGGRVTNTFDNLANYIGENIGKNINE